MPHLLRNLILMILLFCRTLLSCLEAEISVKSILHSKVPSFHTNALTAVLQNTILAAICWLPPQNWPTMQGAREGAQQSSVLQYDFLPVVLSAGAIQEGGFWAKSRMAFHYNLPPPLLTTMLSSSHKT